MRKASLKAMFSYQRRNNFTDKFVDLVDFTSFHISTVCNYARYYIQSQFFPRIVNYMWVAE